jgi:hypothetical protein
VPGTPAPSHGLLHSLSHVALHPATGEAIIHAPIFEWHKEDASIGFEIFEARQKAATVAHRPALAESAGSGPWQFPNREPFI